MKVNKEVMRKIVATIKNNKKEKGVNKMTRKESTLRKILLRGGEVGRSLIGTDAYYELIEELKTKAFDIAIIIIDNCYLDTTCELDELDNIVIDIKEFQDFYDEVLDRETKIEIEEDLMEDLEIELRNKPGYVIGYDCEKAKIILNEKFYNENLSDYEEGYEDIEFVKTVTKENKREEEVSMNRSLINEVREEIRQKWSEEGVKGLEPKYFGFGKDLYNEELLNLMRTEYYNDLVEGFKKKVFKIFLKIVEVDCINTTEELAELDNIIVDLREYELFYEKVLDTETKILIEESLMKELEMHLASEEGYVVAYFNKKPVMIMCESYYKDYIEEYFNKVFEEKCDICCYETECEVFEDYCECKDCGEYEFYEAEDTQELYEEENNYKSFEFISTNDIKKKVMKTISFVVRGSNNSGLYLKPFDVDLEKLTGLSRVLAEAVDTTLKDFESSRVYLRSEKSIEELLKQQGYTEEDITDIEVIIGEDILKINSIIVWEWDIKRDYETPEEYFVRHGIKMKELGGKLVRNIMRVF